MTLGPRLLYIVSRDSPELYERFARAFADDPDVEVVLDRRRTDRRQRDLPHSAERRVRERRSASIEATLQRLGWAVVGAGAALDPADF